MRGQRRFLSWTVRGRRLGGALFFVVIAAALVRTPARHGGWQRLGLEVEPAERDGLVPNALPGQVLRAQPEQPQQPSAPVRLSEPVYRGPRDRPWVTLTFNVDWGEEHLPGVLEALREHRVTATFFFTGRWVRNFPEAARQVAEEGHEVGNHGMEHVEPTRLSDAELDRLILEAERVIQEATGQRPVLFAPPYGEVDRRVAARAGRLGYHTVMWTIDTLDWKRPQPEAIARRVLSEAANGAIVLMHPTEPTARALRGILAELKRRGFVLVPAGRMLQALQFPEEPRPQQEVAPGP